MKIDFESHDKRLFIQGEAIPALWLRERAATPDQLDMQTRQRLYDPHQLADDLYIESVQVLDDQIKVWYSDGYHGSYAISAIESDIHPSATYPDEILWDSDQDNMPRFNWHDIERPEAEFKVMKSFLQFGYVLLENTPLENDGFFRLAHYFGFIKQTAHGRSFQVLSRPDYNDLAYQPVSLASHTDMPYSNPTPGIQILQCRINETSGGLSTLVDSLACGAALREENPEGYEMLASIPVRFEYHSAEQVIIDEKTIFETDDAGNLIGVRYSPRLDYMPLLSDTDTRKFHRARHRLGQLLNDSTFMLQFSLQSGEAIIFDNNRALHGRTAYDQTEGHRHLEGCYVDRDGPKIRYLTLARQLKL